MPRSLRPLLFVTLAVATVAGLTSTTAAATAAAAAVSRPIVGDVTSDGLADQVTLGADRTAVTPTCSARVRPGLPGGGTAGGAFRPLPVRGAMVMACPDLGVVVAGPTPATARLAVAWSSVPPVGGRTVQFFRWTAATQTWTYDGGTTGQYQPSILASRDVDGDGYGDLVETTDQGSGVSVFAGRASSYHQVWSSAPSSADRLSFADFDHHAGVDVLDGYSFFGSLHVGVTVVDGRTGTTQILVADTSDSPSSYVPQAVDVDHDGWLDVRVRVTGADGSPRPTIVFRNRANGTLAFTRV